MNEKTAVIDFFCDVTQKSAQTLVSVVNGAMAEQIDKIIIRLSSTGGSLSPAFGAYHFLRSVKVPLVMYNYGNVESSAILLYLAADTRIAAPHGQFLIHPFHWTFGPSPVPLPKIVEAVASLNFDVSRYAEIFKERTEKADKPLDVIECLEGKPSVIGAEVAASCGLTTETPAVYADAPTGAIRAWIVEA